MSFKDLDQSTSIDSSMFSQPPVKEEGKIGSFAGKACKWIDEKLSVDQKGGNPFMRGLKKAGSCFARFVAKTVARTVLGAVGFVAHSFSCITSLTRMACGNKEEGKKAWEHFKAACGDLAHCAFGSAVIAGVVFTGGAAGAVIPGLSALSAVSGVMGSGVGALASSIGVPTYALGATAAGVGISGALKTRNEKTEHFAKQIEKLLDEEEKDFQSILEILKKVDLSIKVGGDVFAKVLDAFKEPYEKQELMALVTNQRG